MKQILRCLAVFLCSLGAANAQTAISASNITDAFGHPVAVAKLCFVPTDASKSPAGFRVGSTQVVPNEACANVAAGVLESGKTVVPTAAGINYHVYLKQSFANTVIRDYGFTPITGGSWSLDSFDPTVNVTTALSPPLATGVGVPSSCTAPSIWLQTDSPAMYTCKNGAYAAISTKGDTGATGATGQVSNSALASEISYTYPGARNLLNPFWTHPNILTYDGSPFVPTNVATFNAGFYVSVSADVTGLDGKQIVSNMAIYNGGTGYPYYWRDATGAIINPTTGGVPAGTPFTVPSGAVRLEAFGFNDNTNNTNLYPVNKIGVFAGTSLPNPFVPFFATDIASKSSAALATGTAAFSIAQPFSGNSPSTPLFVWFGDSITAGVGSDSSDPYFPQPLPHGVFAKLGLGAPASSPDFSNPNYQLMHAQPGRAMSQAFVDFGGVVAPTKPTTGTGVSGKTLAQELAIAKYAVVFLGTNDKTVDGGAYSLGDAVTDTSSSLTFAGYCKYVAETIQTANPNIRLVFVTPYYNGAGYGDFPNNANMIRTVAAQYGAPVISLDQLVGWGTANFATFLVSDKLHPNSASGTGRLSSVIANALRSLSVSN